MPARLAPRRLHAFAASCWALAASLLLAVGCLAGTASAQAPPANRTWTLGSPTHDAAAGQGSDGHGAAAPLSSASLRPLGPMTILAPARTCCLSATAHRGWRSPTNAE